LNVRVKVISLVLEVKRSKYEIFRKLILEAVGEEWVRRR
jgi:hypothetical protein